MSKRRFRFRLSSLLIVSTAVVLFLGYAQWRRQFLQREAEALLTRDVLVMTNNDFYKPVGFWPPPPEKAFFTVYADGANRIGQGRQTYTVEEAKSRFGELERRSKRLGVREFSICMLHCPECGGADTLYSVDEFDRYADDGKY
jgi:hypothetical protein